ncbi:general secretion pathway protein GspK [Pseudomarimonas salicorniae]|uniref:General secretion pathway protein GspK n=1 Tax=Pseudomarimonas salicorniae TaxID=2933270 RepID=A0ABT0GJ70_9GAMM|nr:type II secretion system protein GspK [Lysobacter sp. CAU 1642]MCK7594578.1 general secretion pathway protein GspK [Lysobacter sp. CAU 1642]
MIATQRGAAFLIVMWLLALLAIILGAFALLARSERLQARHLYDTTQARYAAEAGVHRAVFAMAIPDPTQRWVPDGRPYTIEFGGAQIEVEVTDETGKIDLNSVDVTVLSQFLMGFELPLDEANALAAAIIDWRDPDDLVTLNGAEIEEYEAAGLDYGPRNAPFELIAEVQQVLGMNYALFEQVAPYLTIYSGLAMPNPSFAAAPVLQALPGMDPALAEQALAARFGFDPVLGGDPVAMPDGTPLVVTAGSGTYSIRSRARLPNGAWTELDTAVRLGGVPISGLAFSVLRWQDGAQP